MVGDLEGYGPIWYYADGIANIISMYIVTRTMHVQYDSLNSDGFIVWRNDGSYRAFQPGIRGLYYCDTSNIKEIVLLMDQIQWHK